MSALTDRLLADAKKKVLAYYESGMSTEGVERAIANLLDAHLRALAGETLDAAMTDPNVLRAVKDCRESEWSDNVPALFRAVSPLIRAPLLVQVAELEAQLAAAREAVKDICEWRQKWDCGDYSCQNGSCYKEDSTACEFFKRLDAALTGATQQ